MNSQTIHRIFALILISGGLLLMAAVAVIAARMKPMDVPTPARGTRAPGLPTIDAGPYHGSVTFANWRYEHNALVGTIMTDDEGFIHADTIDAELTDRAGRVWRGRVRHDGLRNRSRGRIEIRLAEANIRDVVHVRIGR